MNWFVISLLAFGYLFVSGVMTEVLWSSKSLWYKFCIGLAWPIILPFALGSFLIRLVTQR